MSDNIIARLFKASAQANADQVQQVIITQAADGSLLLNGSINVVNAVCANDGLYWLSPPPEFSLFSQLEQSEFIKDS